MVSLRRKCSLTRLKFASLGICLTYLIYRTRSKVYKEHSRDKENDQDRHTISPDNPKNRGNQMSISSISNDEFVIRNAASASPINSKLTSADKQSSAQQITLSITSLQTNATSNVVYPLFQSAEEMEFPTMNGKLPRIPHIIHQIYADEMIPEMYINHVKSFIQNNPTWRYQFWTDESGRKLLKKHHPYLVKVYDDFGHSVKRSDLLRYAVLYEFGGFYADLDMNNLRPLNITTMKYACIVPVEPFEQNALIFNKDFYLSNAIMSCRAKHPFLKSLLFELQWATSKGYPVGTSGSGYVTKQFIQYNNISFVDANRNKTDLSSNSPYFYKGTLNEADNNSVYVPNSQYFMDKLDPMHVQQIKLTCESNETLSYLEHRACAEFHRRKYIREKRKYTFTVHQWYHLWFKQKADVNRLKKVNISDIVPNCIFYTG